MMALAGCLQTCNDSEQCNIPSPEPGIQYGDRRPHGEDFLMQLAAAMVPGGDTI